MTEGKKGREPAKVLYVYERNGYRYQLSCDKHQFTIGKQKLGVKSPPDEWHYAQLQAALQKLALLVGKQEGHDIRELLCIYRDTVEMLCQEIGQYGRGNNETC